MRPGCEIVVDVGDRHVSAFSNVTIVEQKTPSFS